MIRIDGANAVSLIGCRPGILAAIPVMEAVAKSLDCVALLTSGTDGKHRKGSLHYVPHGLALDFALITREGRLATVPTHDAAAHDLAARLGVGFDVLREGPPKLHLHVERDPKKLALDAWERGPA